MKYLHRKLSTLQETGSSSGMLETVLSERSVPPPTHSSGTNPIGANKSLKDRLANMVQKPFSATGPGPAPAPAPDGIPNGHGDNATQPPAVPPKSEESGDKEVDPEAKERAREEEEEVGGNASLPAPPATEGPSREDSPFPSQEENDFREADGMTAAGHG